MRQLIFVIALLTAPAARADEATWVKLTGSAIAEALTGRVLQYEAAWQDFRASGRTLYHAGRDSWGYWRVENDQYCSMWPPSDLWACYDMTRNGGVLRFIGAGNDITEAVYRE